MHTVQRDWSQGPGVVQMSEQDRIASRLLDAPGREKELWRGFMAFVSSSRKRLLLAGVMLLALGPAAYADAHWPEDLLGKWCVNSEEPGKQGESYFVLDEGDTTSDINPDCKDNWELMKAHDTAVIRYQEGGWVCIITQIKPIRNGQWYHVKGKCTGTAKKIEGDLERHDNELIFFPTKRTS